ncbi:MAG: dihydroorotase [Bacteroidota bacterium]|nr:dihydroorotase [Bacteroidota bacterium]
MKPLLIYNALIINEGISFNGSVLIENGFITDVFSEKIPDSVLNASEMADATGKWLLPGAIDDHVHFREPGLTHKADLASESMAALAGGITSYMDMPNTIPQTITIQAWKEKMGLAAEKSLANYAFYLGATNGNLSELLQADFSRICGVKVFMGSSTGNMLVDNEKTLEAIFRSVPALIAIHAESERIIQRNKSRYIEETGGELPIDYHPLIRSAEACFVASAKAVELASNYNARLHLLHLTTAKELTLLEQKPLSEKKITAEACVLHLWFDDQSYALKGNAIKCNPAVKTVEDKEALRKGIASGLIDVIATDHAPHAWTEKQGNCLTAASGAPSIQFSLLLMLELARQGCFPVETVIERMCHAPATLFHIDKRGYIRKGYHADLVLIDPAVSWTLSREQLLSKCAWSPFEGEQFHHSVYQTYLNGRLVYDHGTIIATQAAEALRFN